MNFCTQCGARLSGGGNYCSACGAPLKTRGSADQKRQTSTTPQPLPHNPPVTDHGTGSQASQRLQSQKSHLPLIISISATFTLLAIIGLTAFLTAGISSAISEEELKSMGFECDISQPDLIEWLPQEATSNVTLEDVDVLRCDLQNKSYNLYSSYSLAIMQDAFLQEEVCEGASSRNYEQSLEAFNNRFEELANTNMLRAGQYIFDAEFPEGKQALEGFFNEQGIETTKPVVNPSDCGLFYF